MNEHKKLREAEYFYLQLVNPARKTAFAYNVRGLLIRGRSLIAEAREEAARHTAGVAWCDWWEQQPLIAFVSSLSKIDFREHDGREASHRFSSWRGPEDARTVCREYLDLVEQYIAEGRSQGFLR